MYELEKSEIGVEKITFPCFYIFAFCSLTDTPTNNIFIEFMLIHDMNVQRKKIVVCLNKGLQKLHFHIFTILPFVA